MTSNMIKHSALSVRSRLTQGLLSFALVLIFVSSAKAIMVDSDQFVPSECGAQIPTSAVQNSAADSVKALMHQFELPKAVGVEKVCIGLLGEGPDLQPAPAVGFVLSGGQIQAFKILRTTDNLIYRLDGTTQTNIFLDGGGQLFAIHVTRGPDHRIISSSGALAEIQFKTSAFVPVLTLE